MKEFETVVVQAKPTMNGFRAAEELIKIQFVGTELIRCKDCEYFVLASGHRRCDLRCKEMVEPEGFCSWAQKRED